MMMKRISLLLAACAAAAAASAQIPMPGWGLSDVIERQSGVVNYTYEKFDFDRLPTPRRLTEFLRLKDTVEYKLHIYHVTVCDDAGPVAHISFQQDPQVARKEQDSVTFVSTANPWLQITATANLPLDATDAAIARTVDSLRNIRVAGEGLELLPANQDGVSYALEYLFARAGIDTDPLLTWRTYVFGSEGSTLIGYCCDRVKRTKIGDDIERFARKAKFEEDVIYVLAGNEAMKNPIVFFWCDDKFWAKIGPCQYLSFDSVISVWRHDKRATHLDAYRLKERFR